MRCPRALRIGRACRRAGILMRCSIAGGGELSALFPRFEDSMREDAAVLDLDAALELAVLNPDGWAKRRHTGHLMLLGSRLLIESVVRDRIRTNLRIKLVEGTDVTGLLSAPGDTSRVTGVEIRKAADSALSLIEADLVVDCTGRNSRAPEWLKRLGYPEVEVEVVDAEAGYSTCWYQAPPADTRPASWWWKGGVFPESLGQSPSAKRITTSP